MTLADIKNRIYFMTGTDATSYPAADMLLAINNAQDQAHSVILESQDGWRIDDTTHTGFPIAYANLVANQADYAFPTGILKIHSLEVKYAGNWYKAQPLTEGQATASFDDYAFSTANPFYSATSNAVILYPTPTAAVTDGLKLVYDRNFNLFTSSELTAGTRSPIFDRNFHDIIPLKCSLDWAMFNGSPKSGNFKALLDELTMKLRQHYGNKQKDRRHELTPLIENYL
jgi:hypothetical protein